MADVRIRDSLSQAGSPTRINEDAFGANSTCAFVIDGATGLGPHLLGETGSDAAWLAGHARDCFEELVTAESLLEDVVRVTNERARSMVTRLVPRSETVPAWQWPVAGFQLIRLTSDGIETYGLGDCRLFHQSFYGHALDFSAMEDRDEENEGAKGALALVGGLGNMDPLAHSAVTDALRARRATYNRPGTDIWTLGIEPEAASHLVSHRLAIELPARGILCTDGFAALVDTYGRYTPASLIEAAMTRGLSTLFDELRDIEHREDPDGARFPRYKRSDDATAVLYEIA
jgi:hypothetical protein